MPQRQRSRTRDELVREQADELHRDLFRIVTEGARGRRGQAREQRDQPRVRRHQAPATDFNPAEEHFLPSTEPANSDTNGATSPRHPQISTPSRAQIRRLQRDNQRLRREQALLGSRLEVLTTMIEDLAERVPLPQCHILHHAILPVSEARQTPCGHVFCRDCVTKWLRQNQGCPLCRTAVRASELGPMGRVDGDGASGTDITENRAPAQSWPLNEETADPEEDDAEDGDTDSDGSTVVSEHPVSIEVTVTNALREGDEALRDAEQRMSGHVAEHPSNPVRRRNRGRMRGTRRFWRDEEDDDEFLRDVLEALRRSDV